MIQLFIPPLFEKVIRMIPAVFRRRYSIGSYTLSIPLNWSLPDIQKKHKLYDRFLPVLAKHFTGNSSIIDVGANIGDTTIALLQVCKNPILSIEPSELFHSYLLKNLSAVNSEDKKRVEVIKKLVGTGEVAGTLRYSKNSTATLQVATIQNSATHTPLNNLVKEPGNVILIKVDTDGFDFDVILSGAEILTQSEPLLFWENDIQEEFQLIGYSKMYKLLQEKGYNYLYIFDNYGNLMTEESNFKTLLDINQYGYSMKGNNLTRTIYYTDVLACTDKNLAIAKASIKEYRTKWINRNMMKL